MDKAIRNTGRMMWTIIVLVGLLCLAGARRRTALACGAGLLAHLVFYAAYNVPEHGGFFTGCAVLLAVMAACRLPTGALAGLLAVQIAAGAWIGTPPAISASVEPQTDAIDVEPLDDSTSLTTRIVYGQLSRSGRTGTIARSASSPWPISRRLGDPTRPASPVEYGGML